MGDGENKCEAKRAIAKRAIGYGRRYCVTTNRLWVNLGDGKIDSRLWEKVRRVSMMKRITGHELGKRTKRGHKERQGGKGEKGKM